MFSSANIHNSVNKIFHSVVRILAESFYFLDSHFTYLSILLIGIIGSILFFITGYLCRYNKHDLWKWKGRALFKSIKFCLILILLKGVFQIIK